MNKLEKLKNILFTLLLVPLFPILGVPGEPGQSNNDTGSNSNSGDNDDEGNTGEDGNSDGSGDDDESNTGGESQISMTQNQLDALISRRVKKAEKNALKKYEYEKQKASLSETDKLKLEKEEAEKRAGQVLENANRRLIKAEVTSVSSRLGIVSPKAAYKLLDLDDIEIDDTGDVLGVEKALKDLMKEFPFLTDSNVNSNQQNTGKPGGDDQNKNPSKKQLFDMNSLIRKAAGR